MNWELGRNSKTARLAGLLFLGVVAFGIFAEFSVRGKLIDWENSVNTFENIVNHQQLFRIGIMSDLLMNTCYFLFGIVIYHLLKSVNKKQAQFMLMCILLSVASYSVNMLNQVAVLIISNKTPFLSDFNDLQLSGLTTLFMKIHGHGYKISQIFFGLYLFPLGYLFYHSGFLPKWIGIILMIGCAVDLIDVVVHFLLPETDSVILSNITIPADLGELSMFLWLLIMGVNEYRKDKK
ncbi:MAG: DUF4386 domain-containing protein [Reichenbachiella sp.]